MRWEWELFENDDMLRVRLEGGRRCGVYWVQPKSVIVAPIHEGFVGKWGISGPFPVDCALSDVAGVPPEEVARRVEDMLDNLDAQHFFAPAGRCLREGWTVERLRLVLVGLIDLLGLTGATLRFLRIRRDIELLAEMQDGRHRMLLDVVRGVGWVPGVDPRTQEIEPTASPSAHERLEGVAAAIEAVRGDLRDLPSGRTTVLRRLAAFLGTTRSRGFGLRRSYAARPASRV